MESGLLNILEPFCGIIFQCISRTHHLRSFSKKNCIKCLLNLILQDKPTIISAYIILRVSDLAVSASFSSVLLNLNGNNLFCLFFIFSSIH